MKKVHVFRSVKGGVGCTVNAVGFASWLAKEYDEPVLVIGVNDDVKSVMSYSATNVLKNIEVHVLDDLSSYYLQTLVDDRESGYVVIDAGQAEMRFLEEWESHLCIQNHYLALRRAVNRLEGGLNEYDNIVVTVDTEAPLGVEDAKLVTRLPVFFAVARDAKIQRFVDAGMFPRVEHIDLFSPVLATV